MVRRGQSSQMIMLKKRHETTRLEQRKVCLPTALHLSHCLVLIDIILWQNFGLGNVGILCGECDEIASHPVKANPATIN